jgi:predicted acylesterase/phospholipase RssA
MAAAGGLAGLSARCAPIGRTTAVPKAQTVNASVLGLPNERFFPGYGTDSLRVEYEAAIQRRHLRLSPGELAKMPPGQVLPHGELLAVSGGGENGAFGAGLLCGWSTVGTRPEFAVVTGVSTGALIAPFAFLGSAYDAQLRAVYTKLSPADVLKARIFTAALFSDAMADNSPLFKTISRYLNTDLQAAIAKAYDDGRLLFVGTTNLDAQQRVIWNVGAIAASKHPRALDLIRRLLLASAAIPGAFPPTMIDVTLDGVSYQEMHVDGGAFTQAFLYPRELTVERRERIRKGLPVVDVNAYVIRNARVDPGWVSVERRTLGIAARAISTLIEASGNNDLIRISSTCQNDGVGYNLAVIGPDFAMVLPRPFDAEYMRGLFDYGYQEAVHGYKWAKAPPEF